MNLPNYFLADLPTDTPLSAGLISDACQTLKKNRETFLCKRPTQSLIRILAEVARSWMEPNDPFRNLALKDGPSVTGFSREILQTGLDEFFAQITTENLQALIVQEFGDLRRLDSLCSNSTEEKINRAAFVRGPELLAHITGGVIPNATLTSIILGLLTRSAQFVKCARGTSFIPRLFAHSIYEVEPKLASCLEIAEHPRVEPWTSARRSTNQGAEVVE